LQQPSGIHLGQPVKEHSQNDYAVRFDEAAINCQVANLNSRVRAPKVKQQS
jgi:hypothetical protein